MSPLANSQLKEIHSMLAVGHRSIRMERHTLILWGIAAAFLILTAELIFNNQRFPIIWQQIVAMNLYISIVLISTGAIEHLLTRRIRQQRDETISFVQRQLTKVWWLLAALIVVINIGMSIYGGGFLFYGIAIILVGLALYIHGLFSQQMLTWGGIMLIVLGLITVALLPTYAAQKSLAIAVFGIGMPALAWIIDRSDIAHLNIRSLLISAGWLTAVILPATLGHYIFVNNNVDNQFSDVQELSWEAYSQQTDIVPDTLQIVKLAAGTTIPIHLTINSELIANTTEVEIPLVISEPIQMTMKNGKAEGHFRTGTGTWVQRYGIRDFTANTFVSNTQGPYVDMRFKLIDIK